MAKLIIDGLATCLTIKEVKLALVDIPFGLPVAYDATMQRIIDQGQSRFRRAFEVMKWVLFAKRPLSSAEIEHAVGVEHGSEDIDLDNIVPATTLASLCAGLIVIDGYGNFRFIHQTVPEYLIRYHSEKFLDAEAELADGCLTYIRYKTFMEGPCRDIDALEARHLRYPAYSYCTRYWYQHLYGTPNEEQKRVALQFFQDEPYWRSANQVTQGSRDDVSGMLSRESDTILHYAAFLDAHLMFDDLMRLDSTCLNIQDSLGKSPLMVAACCGCLKIASRLLEAGAQVDTLDNYGCNALHLAALMDKKDLVALLLANPRVNVDALTASGGRMPGGQTAVILAAREGYVIILSRLVKAGAEVNRLDNHGLSALHAAAIEGHSQVVDLLIATPQIDLNVRINGQKHTFGGESSLFNAVRNGHVDIVTSLITAGAELNIVNDEGNTALHVAVEAGHVAVVEALVNSGMDVDLPQENNSTGRRLSAVMLASLKWNLNILDIVLKHSRDINLRSANGGRTALLYAIRCGNVDAVELLLSHKTIEVELADDDGWTPLTYAANYGRVGIIPDLVAHGANLNGPTVLGDTPIMIAVRQNQTETTKALLSFPGGDVNAVSRHEGCAPLHDAVSWGNAELVELLISYGADVQTRDGVNNLTPLDYARYFNDHNILDLLEASEAESRIPSD
jgi:ankyrin repeat domain-containing protein 50